MWQNARNRMYICTLCCHIFLEDTMFKQQSSSFIGMRGRNHCPIENFSIVFAHLDDEVPAGTIEILILSGEAKREGCVVACCLYLAVIEYLVVLIAPYLDAALSRIVLYEATADIGMLDILVARQCDYLLSYRCVFGLPLQSTSPLPLM